MSPEDAPHATDGRPAIRAVQTQNLLRLVGDLPVPVQQEYAAVADPQLVAEVTGLRTMSWVPMEHHMPLCEALYAIVGRERFVDLFRLTFVESVSKPLLQGIFGLMRKVSPNSVPMLLRNASRIYGHVTRDVGAMTYASAGAGQALLTIEGWPSHRFDFDCWIDGTHGTVLGALEGIGARDQAEVTVEQREAAKGTAAYRVRW